MPTTYLNANTNNKHCSMFSSISWNLHPSPRYSFGLEKNLLNFDYLVSSEAWNTSYGPSSFPDIAPAHFSISFVYRQCKFSGNKLNKIKCYPFPGLPDQLQLPNLLLLVDESWLQKGTCNSEDAGSQEFRY